MVRKMYSANGIFGTQMIGFQVIGASPEECYGEGIPVKSGKQSDGSGADGKSWWEKRHERMEELMEEQAADALTSIWLKQVSGQGHHARIISKTPGNIPCLFPPL